MVYKFIFYCFLFTLTGIPIIYYLTKSNRHRTYLNFLFFAWVVNAIFQLIIAFIITFALILLSISGNTGEGFSYVQTVKYLSIISTLIWYVAGIIIVYRMEKTNDPENRVQN